MSPYFFACLVFTGVETARTFGWNGELELWKVLQIFYFAFFFCCYILSWGGVENDDVSCLMEAWRTICPMSVCPSAMRQFKAEDLGDLEFKLESSDCNKWQDSSVREGGKQKSECRRDWAKKEKKISNYSASGDKHILSLLCTSWLRKYCFTGSFFCLCFWIFEYVNVFVSCSHT